MKSHPARIAAAICRQSILFIWHLLPADIVLSCILQILSRFLQFHPVPPAVKYIPYFFPGDLTTLFFFQQFLHFRRGFNTVYFYFTNIVSSSFPFHRCHARFSPSMFPSASISYLPHFFYGKILIYAFFINKHLQTAGNLVQVAADFSVFGGELPNGRQ